jgi:hypothetical protein
MEPLSFHARPWCEAARAALAPLADQEPGGVERVAQDVQAGRWTLWEARRGSSPLGFLVTSIEPGPDGAELFIHYGVGGDPRAPVAGAGLRLAEHLARELGARRLAFWTRRDGLKAIAERAGWAARHVLERELA